MQHINIAPLLLICSIIGVPGLRAQTVKDIEGNIYKTTFIGKQVWMVENLKSTKYNDGTIIRMIPDNAEWSSTYDDGYCWYNNEKNNGDMYGALYNWGTIKSKKLCPIGWHVPDDNDWIVLANNLGGENIAGGKLKDTGITHWKKPNVGATNESGFKALPGGYRNYSGTFDFLGVYSTWWTSTEVSSTYAWSRFLKSEQGSILRYDFNKKYGFSVRCIKN